MKKWICPICGVTISGPSYPKLHTCTKNEMGARIKQLEAKNKILEDLIKELKGV